MAGKAGMESLELPELTIDHDEHSLGTSFSPRTAGIDSTHDKHGLQSKTEADDVHLLVDRDGIPSPSLGSGKRVTFEQVLWQTYWARVCHGPAAVAPVLRPYLNATRWPSGSPLPLHILQSTRQGARPWFQFQDSGAYPDPLQPLMIPAISNFTAIFPIFFSGMIGAGLVSSFGSAAAWPLLCFVFLVQSCSSVVGYLESGALTRDRVKLHVRALYLLLFLDNASADRCEQLLSDIYAKKYKNLGNTGLPAVVIQ